MKMSPRTIRALEFEINGKTYEVPPAGIDAGLRIAEIVSTPPAELDKLDMSSIDMFKLAIGDVWDQMRHDNVPTAEAFRVGLACLAREQVLLVESGPDRWEKADRAAEAVWESGIDPEALAAYMAAMTPSAAGAATNRSTRRAAARTTRSRSSGTGTRSPKTSASSKPAVRPSR